MIDNSPILSPSDKDLFDLLMSDKVRLSISSVRRYALRRGIIISEAVSHEDLAEYIASMSHDYSSLMRLLEMREHPMRADRRTYLDFDEACSKEEVALAISNYKKLMQNREEITSQPRRARDMALNVGYNEVDYSKTRLIQKQRKDAEIDITIAADKVTFRLPSTDAARNIVKRLCLELSKVKLKSVDPRELTLNGLSADQRTEFFLKLISSVKGYDLQTVTNVRVASDNDEISDDVGLDLEEDRSMSSDDIGRIANVALSGTNLIESDMYQNLRKGGFYITAITWRSLQLEKPQDLMQFDVAFEQPREGIGFRFHVRFAKRMSNGELTTGFRPVEVTRQPTIWGLMEAAASTALQHVIRDSRHDLETHASQAVA